MFFSEESFVPRACNPARHGRRVEIKTEKETPMRLFFCLYFNASLRNLVSFICSFVRYSPL